MAKYSTSQARAIAVRIFQKYLPVILHYAGQYDVPAEYLAGLTGMENPNCREYPDNRSFRFEAGVYGKLKRAQSLSPRNWLTWSYNGVKYKHLKGLSDAVLRALSTSFGQTQIMAYYVLTLFEGYTVAQLRDPKLHYMFTCKFLTTDPVLSQQLRKRRFNQVCHVWNSGRLWDGNPRNTKTWDPAYMANCALVAQEFKRLMDADPQGVTRALGTGIAQLEPVPELPTIEPIRMPDNRPTEVIDHNQQQFVLPAEPPPTATNTIMGEPMTQLPDGIPQAQPRQIQPGISAPPIFSSAPAPGTVPAIADETLTALVGEEAQPPPVVWEPVTEPRAEPEIPTVPEVSEIQELPQPEVKVPDDINELLDKLKAAAREQGQIPAQMEEDMTDQEIMGHEEQDLGFDPADQQQGQLVEGGPVISAKPGYKTSQGQMTALFTLGSLILSMLGFHYSPDQAADLYSKIVGLIQTLGPIIALAPVLVKYINSRGKVQSNELWANAQAIAPQPMSEAAALKMPGLGQALGGKNWKDPKRYINIGKIFGGLLPGGKVATTIVDQFDGDDDARVSPEDVQMLLELAKMLKKGTGG